MRIDLADDFIRAVRARAGEDGVSPSDVIAAALEVYLRDELARVRSKIKQADSSAGTARGRKGKEE